MKIIYPLFLFLFLCASGTACTVYKITMNGKTFVGNNEDYWNANTRIWFEKGGKGNYGSSYVGFDDLYPQGGINEKGLTFDGFAISSREIKKIPGKLAFDNNTLRTVMQKCQNVDEVQALLGKYDLSVLYAGMLMFVDPSGKYLVVEGDTMVKGSDSNYLLSNFCPSKTPDPDQVKIPMYQKGRKMMQAKTDTSMSYLKALSDTLHQGWHGNTGGTLYTTIYDLTEKTIHLFFYHDFKHHVTFHLSEELDKGDRMLIIPYLFPANKDGQEHLKHYSAAQEFLLKLKDPAFSHDSLQIASYIKAQDIEAFLPLFESEINATGYELMDKDLTAAIHVFKLNVKYRPDSWNAYDSLAEAYFRTGNTAKARLYYGRSLVLNAGNRNAMDKIRLMNKH